MLEPTNIPALISELRGYQLTLDPNTVICDRLIVDQAADIMAAMVAHIAMLEGRLGHE